MNHDPLIAASAQEILQEIEAKYDAATGEFLHPAHLPGQKAPFLSGAKYLAINKSLTTLINLCCERRKSLSDKQLIGIEHLCKALGVDFADLCRNCSQGEALGALSNFPLTKRAGTTFPRLLRPLHLLAGDIESKAIAERVGPFSQMGRVSVSTSSPLQQPSPIHLSELLGCIWSDHCNQEHEMDVAVDQRAREMADTDAQLSSYQKWLVEHSHSAVPDEHLSLDVLKAADEQAYRFFMTGGDFRNYRSAALAEICQAKRNAQGADYFRQKPWEVMRFELVRLSPQKIDEGALESYCSRISCNALDPSDEESSAFAPLIVALDRDGFTERVLQTLWEKCPRNCKRLGLPKSTYQSDREIQGIHPRGETQSIGALEANDLTSENLETPSALLPLFAGGNKLNKGCKGALVPPNRVKWNDATFELPPRQWRLLAFLWDRDSATFDELRDEVWSEEVSDHSITAAISRLRTHLTEHEVQLTLSTKHLHVTCEWQEN